ncbi:MAG TPA: glycosyltransferase family 2 protein [Chloroflexota bacterium]|nr:glycosyltransferase family 2 protein [Chloroflexota bacterium]
MIDATVIIVSYNVRDFLVRCLSSLEQAAPGRAIEVIVVDNGSSDGTVETIRRLFPPVTVIANGTNPGFGAANNQALRSARGRAVLFLNPDTEVRPGALTTLLEYLETHPEVGMVGPRLLSADGQGQSSRRRFPTLVTALVESTVLQRLWSGWPALRQYYMEDCSDNRTQEVDWLVGACLLVRRTVIDRVGGFDERFFMYSEELDLCRRLRAHDWKIVYLPSATVVHYEGRSSEQNTILRAQRFNESKARYFEKYHGPAVGRALRLFLLASTLAELGIEMAKLAALHRPSLRWQRMRALFAVARYQARHLNGFPLPSAPETGSRRPCA